MNLIKWIRSNPKMTALIVAIIAIVILLSIRNCSNNNQDDHNIISSVAQNTIDKLQEQIADNNEQINTFKDSEIRLCRLVKSKDSINYLLKQKVAVIASNLQKEIDKNHALSNDESVLQFIDNSNCDTTGVKAKVPVCSIRYYNDVQSELKSSAFTNNNLRLQIANAESKSVIQDSIINNKGKQIDKLNENVSGYVTIVGEKDKQINAEHKKFKQQKVKTYITGAIGIILVTLALIQ